MKKELAFIVLLVLVFATSRVSGVDTGVGTGITMETEDFPPLIWICGDRILLDDRIEPGRLAYTAEMNVIVAAADRILDLQYTNGAWDWDVTSQAGPTGTTYLNIAGVTAEVLLDAYKLTGLTIYLDAAKDAGDYLVATIGVPSSSQRQNAFNILFLYHLYDVTGDSQYSNEADAIVNHILHQVNYWSLNNGNHCADDAIAGCTATELLAAYKDYRGPTDPTGIVAWDLYNFIEAATRAGENSFANDVANIIDAYLSQVGYISTVDYYELGLSAGILGLGNAGLDYSSYLADLLAAQNPDGSFGTTEPIQATAYALMALKYADEEGAAEDAVDYLVDNFEYSGYDGWLDGGVEYSEVDSEAAQAIFDFIAEDIDSLVERLNNYAFEGESIYWNVLVMDKNGIEKIEDVFVTLGSSQGEGNDIEANCDIGEPELVCCEGEYRCRNDLCGCYGPADEFFGPEECIPDSCNAMILEEDIEGFDADTMRFYDCTLTVETPDSMYGEYWVTAEVLDLDGMSGTFDENEYWYFNPTIALALDGDLDFGVVRPGTLAYSETMLVGNDADAGSGVLLDMYISGTDFYDSSSSGAKCPVSNVLELTNFAYFAMSGYYSTANVGGVNPIWGPDVEGYMKIPYGNKITQAKEIIGTEFFGAANPNYNYWKGNVLTPGAEMSITFRLDLPEPCNGDFDTGSIYFWGEAV